MNLSLPESWAAMVRKQPGTNTPVLVTATTRPKRVAFLVHPDATCADDLETVVLHSLLRWGGGHYPIVPTDGKGVPDDWWRLLRAVDPDVVQSLLPLEDGLRSRIHREIAPARLVEVRQEELQRRNIWADPSAIEALGIERLPRYLTQIGTLSAPGPRFFCPVVSNINREPIQFKDFMLWNFGLVHKTVAVEHAFDGLHHEFRPVHECEPSEVMREFLRARVETLVPRDLSTRFAVRPYFFSSGKVNKTVNQRSFHVVAGDGVLERLYAWNRPLASDKFVDRDVLWIPGSLAADTTFLKVVGEWIERFFWRPEHKAVSVLSYTIDSAQLAEIGQRICENHLGLSEVARLPPDQFPFPATEPALAYPRYRNEALRIAQQVPLRDGRGLIAYARPWFLPADDTTRGWMVDLEIEYRLDPPRYSNATDQWCLPKRAEIGRLFAGNRGLTRVVTRGLPAVEVTSEDPEIQLRVPSRSGLLSVLIFPARTGGQPSGIPAGFFSGNSISELGRRLRGMADLFGGITKTCRWLEDPYWRRVVAGMSGRPEDNRQTQTDRIVKHLAEAYGPQVPATFDHGEPARKLAEAIFTPTPGEIAYEIKKFESVFYATRNAQPSDGTAMLRPDEKFAEFKEGELRDLVRLGVLLQGAQVQCPHCGTKEWLMVDRLRAILRCGGCTSAFPLELTPTWSFTLNGLVRNAIAKEGMLPLVQALHRLQQQALRFFLVFPCQDLYVETSGKESTFTDLDLIAIVDGEFVVGEVKSSPQGFKQSDFDKLGRIGEELRPDRIICAAPSGPWPAEVRQWGQALRSRLSQIGVPVDCWALEW